MRLGTIIDTKRPLDLDLDTLVATRLLVTATSGGGKSWALRRILDALVDDGGAGMTREQIGEASALEPSSGTFGTYLGELKRNGLAEESGGLIRLAEFLREV